MEELSYKKTVWQNYIGQKILYIVTLISSGGITLLSALFYWAAVPYFNSIMEEARGNEMGGMHVFVGVIGVMFSIWGSLFAVVICIVLISDLILGTISFFLCKTWTKKYMEDSQKLKQYRIYMGVSYGMLAPKILCIFKLFSLFRGGISIILLGMLVLYAGVVAIGIRNTYTERIVDGTTNIK